MTTDCKHARIQTWRFEDNEVAGLWSCADCGRRFEPVAVAPVESMMQRMNRLLAEYEAARDAHDAKCDAAMKDKP